MTKITTQRYDLEFIEKEKGGPGGYEAVYLTSEGYPASEKLYDLLSKGKGNLLPVENKVIRQRNGSELINTIKNGGRLGIASGFKPSGAYHFGHKLTSSAVSFFQQNGAQIFIPIADLECMLDTNMSKENYQFWAADNLLDWGANGVNLDAAHVYLQSEEFRVSNLAYLVARGLDFSLPLDIYGVEKMSEEFPFFFAGMTQVGDIILPQHKDFGNHHSFMVSGQDQDGHMKMTVELVKRALESGIELPGIQTIPSGFYIPHIRGLTGKKQSSSKTCGTLYLGAGSNRINLDERIKKSIETINNAISSPKGLKNATRGALDMVRYIDFFNQQSKVNFGYALEKMPHSLKEKLKETKNDTEKSTIMDSYLIETCIAEGQNNLELVRETIGTALTIHQEKRKEILDYAISKANSRNSITGNREGGELNKPSFWSTLPLEAIVDESKRNTTQWFHIIASMKDKLLA